MLIPYKMDLLPGFEPGQAGKAPVSETGVLPITLEENKSGRPSED